jgi:hypothetical protein
MAVCTSPVVGGRACTDVDFDFLVAHIVTILEYAGESDAIHFGLTEALPRVHANGSLGFDSSFVHLLQQPYIAAHREISFRAAARQYAAAFEISASGDIVKPDIGEFEHAFVEEFGLELEQYGALVRQITELALDGNVRRVRLSGAALLELIVKTGAVSPRKACHALTLPSRHRWDEMKPQGAKPRDWYPWRYHRRLSLTRRPIVQLDIEGNDLVVSPILLDRSAAYLLGCAEGRLPIDLFDSAAMRTWIGRAVDREGHQFNQDVAQRLSDLGWSVRSEVSMTELGAREQLGDIDVIAWRGDVGQVCVIECKRLMFARTIGEIGERLVEYGTLTSSGQRTPIQKHLDRVQYLSANPQRLSKFTGLDSLRLRSALVTDYLAPMQFSQSVAKLVDLVTDYDSLATSF